MLDERAAMCILESMDRTESAREYVRTWTGRLAKLSVDTGLNYHWLAKFGQGVIANPQARKIDALLEHQLRHRKRRRT